VFKLEPSADAPVNVCTKVNACCTLSSVDCDVLLKISTFPACPGALELMASISPLSFASI